MSKRVLQSQVRQMEKLHEEGHSHVAIAAQLGVGRNTVARHLGMAQPAANEDVALTAAEVAKLRVVLPYFHRWACSACGAVVVALASAGHVICACGVVLTHKHMTREKRAV